MTRHQLLAGEKDKFHNLMFEQRVVRGNTYSSNIIKKPEPMRIGQRAGQPLLIKRKLAKLPSVASTVKAAHQRRPAARDPPTMSRSSATTTS